MDEKIIKDKVSDDMVSNETVSNETASSGKGLTEKVIVEIVSDPFCSWCWGSEPELRALETLFGAHGDDGSNDGRSGAHGDDSGHGSDGDDSGQGAGDDNQGNRVKVIQHMGYLIPDVRTEPDFDYAAKGYDGVNRSIGEHWDRPQKVTGMPYVQEKFHMFSEGNYSGLPAAIGFKAAELVAPELAPAYLRRVREGIFVTGEKVIERDVKIRIAGEVGIDQEAFRRVIENGEAEKAFEADIQWADSRNVDLYPTYFLSYGDKRERLAGYITFPKLAKAIERLTEAALAPKYLEQTYESLTEILEVYSHLAVAEVKLLFNFATMAEAEARIKALPADKYKLTAVGETYWVAKRED